MRQENLDQMNDNYIEQLLEEAFGYSDEQLAAELDRAAAEAAKNPDPRLAAPEDEFEKIMARVREEETSTKKAKKVVRIRKVLRPMLVAAVLGTIVLSAGVGVSGKREFEFWKWSKENNSIRYENTRDLQNVDVESNAYGTIEEKLGIRAIELHYVPEKTYFEYLNIKNGRADIVFKYKEGFIHFHQALKSVAISTNIASDRQLYKTVEHREFGNVEIYKNSLEDGRVEYSAHFSVNNAYYYLTGIIEEEEMIKIIERMRYYSG